MLKIGSLNVRGLRDFAKRKNVFMELKKYKLDIIFLQETHSCSAEGLNWENEWGGTIFSAHGSTAARGVMILFKRNLVDLQPEVITRDPEGRYIILKIRTIDGTDCLLVNIYGPNRDDPSYFINLYDKIKQTQIPTMLVGGDFNVPWVRTLDTTAKIDSHAKSRQILHSIAEEANLWDIWRAKNESVLKYTWYRLRPEEIKSRLDYFLISGDLVGDIQQTGIEIPIRTDHCLVWVTWSPSDCSRGRGFWKHNNKLLENKSYLEYMNTIIDTALEKYRCGDPIIKWEMLKQDCIIASKKFAGEQARKVSDRKDRLEKEIKLLMAEMGHRNSETLSIKLENAITELNEIHDEKVQGAIFRSRCIWYGEGEKNSKYFFSLEKSRFKTRNILGLRNTMGEVKTENREILSIASEFYRQLYTETSSKVFNISNVSNEKVTELDNQKFFQDTEVHPIEVGKALNMLSNNKTPGADGLTAEFYKVFWLRIRTPLIEYYNESFKKGELGWSGRRGVLSLIPKRDKDPLEVKNWRPITLLNLDYKIFIQGTGY